MWYATRLRRSGSSRRSARRETHTRSSRGGTARRSPARCRRRARRGDRTWYLDGELLADNAVRVALEKLLSEAGGPPLVAHRAKELMHGLDVDIRTLHHDTAR